jgi:hypothetical protein
VFVERKWKDEGEKLIAHGWFHPLIDGYTQQQQQQLQPH